MVPVVPVAPVVRAPVVPVALLAGNPCMVPVVPVLRRAVGSPHKTM